MPGGKPVSPTARTGRAGLVQRHGDPPAHRRRGPGDRCRCGVPGTRTAGPSPARRGARRRRILRQRTSGARGTCPAPPRSTPAPPRVRPATPCLWPRRWVARSANPGTTTRSGSPVPSGGGGTARRRCFRISGTEPKPGIVAVNAEGRRFVDESVSYHRFTRAMYASNSATRTVPAWLVIDSRTLHRYGVGHDPAEAAQGLAAQVPEVRLPAPRSRASRTGGEDRRRR